MKVMYINNIVFLLAASCIMFLLLIIRELCRADDDVEEKFPWKTLVGGIAVLAVCLWIGFKGYLYL